MKKLEYQILDNKKGAEKLFSIWEIFVLVIVGVGIVAGVYIFYSADIDVRETEAGILYEKIADCIIEQGFLTDKILNDKENFDIYKECDLNKEIIEKEDYYIKINVFSEKGKTITNLSETKSLLEVITYAKFNSIVERKCYCENNCEIYSDFIITASEKYNIPDPFLLLSLMMQESSCRIGAESGSSSGLMQINSWEICKDKLGLTTKEDVLGEENIGNNINCGAIILRYYYDTYGERGIKFNGCTNRNIEYFQWNAALRAYNGNGCGKDSKTGEKLISQDFFVENVTSRYKELKKISGGDVEYSIGSVDYSNENKLRKEIILGDSSFSKDCEIVLSNEKLKAEKYPKCIRKTEGVLYYDNNEIKKAKLEILTASNQQGETSAV